MQWWTLSYHGYYIIISVMLYLFYISLPNMGFSKFPCQKNIISKVNIVPLWQIIVINSFDSGNTKSYSLIYHKVCCIENTFLQDILENLKRFLKNF